MPHLFKGSSFDTVFSIADCVSTYLYASFLSCCLQLLPFLCALVGLMLTKGFCGTPRGGWALNQQKRSCCTKAEKNKIAIKYLTNSHIAGSLLIIFFSLFRFNISELSFHLLVKSNEVMVGPRAPASVWHLRIIVDLLCGLLGQKPPPRRAQKGDFDLVRKWFWQSAKCN